MKKADLILAIKKEVSAVVYTDERLKINFSVHLSQKLNRSYTYLSSVFAKHEGVALCAFVIRKRVERAEDLLMSGGSATEIACLLNYSSIGYFCNQFKSVTGLTVGSYQKQLKQKSYE